MVPVTCVVDHDLDERLLPLPSWARAVIKERRGPDVGGQRLQRHRSNFVSMDVHGRPIEWWPLRTARSVDRLEAAEEVEDGGGEVIVLVTSDHVAGVGDVDVPGAGDNVDEFSYAFGGDEVAIGAADDEGRNPDTAGPIVEEISDRALAERGEIVAEDLVGASFKESDVPVPLPTVGAVLAKNLAKPVGVLGFRASGVGGDDVGCVVERIEAVGVRCHEPDNAFDAIEFHARGDVDEDDGSEELGVGAGLGEERGHAAEGCADDHGRCVEVVDDAGDVVGEVVPVVVGGFGPVAIAVAAVVDGDCLPAVLGDGAGAGVPCPSVLPGSVKEHDGLGVRVTPAVGGESEPGARQIESFRGGGHGAELVRG